MRKNDYSERRLLRFALHATALAMVAAGALGFAGAFWHWQAGIAVIFLWTLPFAFILFGAFTLWQILTGAPTLREWLDELRAKRKQP